jgi:two-component system, NtrC family, nitrogen regulation response regulator GlnG
VAVLTSVEPAPAPAVAAGGGAADPAQVSDWAEGLQVEAAALLESGQPEVWDVLTRRFESRMIQAALAYTGGRRIEAAQKLGIGRNTITRKIQELGLDDH